MSTIRFIATSKPEKNLTSTVSYRYYADKEVNDKILQEVKSHIKDELAEEDVVEVNIEITIKKYDQSKFYYDKILKPTNDTTTT